MCRGPSLRLKVCEIGTLAPRGQVQAQHGLARPCKPLKNDVRSVRQPIRQSGRSWLTVEGTVSAPETWPHTEGSCYVGQPIPQLDFSDWLEDRHLRHPCKVALNHPDQCAAVHGHRTTNSRRATNRSFSGRSSFLTIREVRVREGLAPTPVASPRVFFEPYQLRHAPQQWTWFFLAATGVSVRES